MGTDPSLGHQHTDHAHHDHGHHDHGHGHGHGHAHDQGLRAMVRYLRHAPRMWSSVINQAVVDRIAPQPGETVLDIGAGIGEAAVPAATRGCSVIAVEPTPYMRRTLALRCRLARITDQVTIVDGTAEATTVTADSVDAAWAVNTMHHWHDLDAGASEVVRVLAPGGRLLLVDEDFDNPEHPDHEQFRARQEERNHHFHDVDPTAVARRLQSEGVTVTFAGHDMIAGRPATIVEGHI